MTIIYFIEVQSACDIHQQFYISEKYCGHPCLFQFRMCECYKIILQLCNIHLKKAADLYSFKQITAATLNGLPLIKQLKLKLCK